MNSEEDINESKEDKSGFLLDKTKSDLLTTSGLGYELNINKTIDDGSISNQHFRNMSRSKTVQYMAGKGVAFKKQTRFLEKQASVSNSPIKKTEVLSAESEGDEIPEV